MQAENARTGRGSMIIPSCGFKCSKCLKVLTCIGECDYQHDRFGDICLCSDEGKIFRVSVDKGGFMRLKEHPARNAVMELPADGVTK